MREVREPIGTIRSFALAGSLGLALLGATGAHAGSTGRGGATLLAYLNAVNKIRAPGSAAEEATGAALEKLSNTPGATWVTAAAATTASEKAARLLEATLESLSPPAGLGQGNEDFVEATQIAIRAFAAIISALQRKDVAGVAAAEKRVQSVSTKIDALELKWRVAVDAAASKEGVAVPRWVATLGST